MSRAGLECQKYILTFPIANLCNKRSGCYSWHKSIGTFLAFLLCTHLVKTTNKMTKTNALDLIVMKRLIMAII